MPAPSIPDGLSDLAPAYDALLCDVWGVIHNGREAFPKACEALARYKAEVGPVLLISNSPRPSKAILGQLRAVGVPTDSWSAILTSGDATRVLLEARSPGPAWAVGPARDTPLYEGLGLDFVEEIHDAAFISCTGPFDDDNETPEDYRLRFQVGVDLGLEMICANPDRVVQRGNKLIYCGGALAELYEAMGGRTIMAGKPYAPIYDIARLELERMLGRAPDPRRLLAIGDGVATDLKGAEEQDIDCLFIAEGIHGDSLMDAQGRPDPDRVDALLTRSSTYARYAMAELCW